MSEIHRSVEFSGPSTPVGGASLFMPEEGFVPNGCFVQEDVLVRVKHLPANQFLLIESEFRELDQPGLKAKFVAAPELAYGREENSRQLDFGQIILSSDTDFEKTELVAIKPFDKPSEAVHEFGVMRHLNRLSKRRPTISFSPLGFTKTDKGTGVALITEYDESVISYDNLFWDSEKVPSQEHVKKALSRCAFALGSLHYYGLIHLDAQAKNLAADNVGVRFIDLESAAAFPVTDGVVDPEGTRAGIIDDIQKFAGSLNRPFTEEEDLAKRDYSVPFKTHFATSYSRAVRLPSSLVPQEARLTPAEVADLQAAA